MPALVELIIMAVTAGASSSSLEGTEPPPKKSRSRVRLPVSSWYVCVGSCLPLLRDLLFLSSFLSSKKVVSRRQEVYLNNSDCSLAGCMPRVSPAPDSRGAVTGGDSMGSTDRGVDT
jgi:hypothetical protein